MRALIKIGVWIKKYWYIPLFILVTIAGWIFFSRKGTPFKQTVAEVKAIQAEANVKKLKEMLGTEKAKIVVTENYKTELEQLDEKQKEQANELKDDPAKLAKFLVRSSSR